MQTTDNGGSTFAKVFTITVTNVNEAPTMISASSTNVRPVQPLVPLSATCRPPIPMPVTRTLIRWSRERAILTMPKFSITNNQLRTAATFASQTSYSIRVRSTDAAGLTVEQVITGTIGTATNAAPTDIA